MTHINQSTHPIQSIWIAIPSFRGVIGVLISFVFFIFFILVYRSSDQTFLIFLISFIALCLPFQAVSALFSPFMIVWRHLTRKNLEYEFGDEQIIYRQGILSKSERTIRYGVLQNVIITRDLVERLIGSATVSIENASNGGAILVQGNTNLMNNSILIPCSFILTLAIREDVLSKNDLKF
jgi:uncharacterized membrane protein YdbT with pleckstrin-like domain